MKTTLFLALGALAASLAFNVRLHRQAQAAPEAKIDIDRLNLTDDQVRRIKG